MKYTRTKKKYWKGIFATAVKRCLLFFNVFNREREIRGIDGFFPHGPNPPPERKNEKRKKRSRQERYVPARDETMLDGSVSFFKK